MTRIGTIFSACAMRLGSAFEWLDTRRWKILAFTLPAILLLHLCFESITIQRSNLDWRPSDQMAEVWLATAARNDLLPARTDGVRHPLWSWTVSHIYHEDKITFFTRGKWLNLAFCLVFLAALGIGVTRWLDPLATCNLLLLSSLGILLVRSAFFQPEPLYFIFFFLSGLLAFGILRGACWWQFPAFGVVSGLAFLAKPSLLPFLLAFTAAFCLRLGLSFVFHDRNWPPLANLLRIAASGVIFLSMLLPLGCYTIEHYGKPLFSYTKYWMWMDDFKSEAYPFSVSHPGRQELEKMTPEETPGVAWYFHRHTLRDAWVRVTGGAKEVTWRYFFPEPGMVGQSFFWRQDGRKWQQPLAHRGVYLLTLFGLCLLLAWPSRQEVARRCLEHGNLTCIALTVMVFGIYIALYGWYFQIGKGDRFMGSLWIPGVFLACWVASRLRRLSPRMWGDAIYLSTHCLILLSLVLQVACIAWLFSQGFFLKTHN